MIPQELFLILYIELQAVLVNSQLGFLYQICILIIYRRHKHCCSIMLR